MPVVEVPAILRLPRPAQRQVLDCTAKRIVVKAGRRFGKTVGASIKGLQRFLAGGRVLYAAPTSEQTDRFWFEINRALDAAVRVGIFRRNETERYVEREGTRNRIKAKTAWNADSLRGDDADLLILDEFQLMNEDTWGDVGAPMLLDNNGDAMFIYTPPSLKTIGVSKARDPRHASKMFKMAREDTTGRWAVFHFTSFDNPDLSKEALTEISRDMGPESYRKEILAEDEDIEQSWLVYGKLDQRACVIPAFPLAVEWLRYVGHDFGISNPAALFVALDPATGNFFVYDEYLPGPGRSVAEHVVEWKKRTEGLHVIKRVGGNLTTEEETRQAYAAHGWPIVGPKQSRARVNDQIDAVLALMNLNKLYVFAHLHAYLTELNNCMWVLDNENRPTVGKVKDEAKYHLCAAARYILSDFTPETADRTTARVKHSSFRF